MKIRNGYVSNSSSSSFIITNKDNFDKVIELVGHTYGDYYILRETMYTSFISDGYSPQYSELYDLCTDHIDGGHSYPYDEDDFLEIEGTIGICSVWLPKEVLTDEDYRKFNKVPPIIKDNLYDFLIDYIKCNRYKNMNKEQLIEILDKCKEIIEGEFDED